MLKLYTILFVIIMLAFLSFKKEEKPKRFDIYSISHDQVDSLRKKGIDTLLIFHKGCSGCIIGVPESIYIMWKNGSELLTMQIDNFYGIREVKRMNDILPYYYSHLSLIENEKIDSNNLMDHYYYNEIQFLSSKHNFKVIIPDFYIGTDDNSFLSNWVYRIESSLFNIK